MNIIQFSNGIETEKEIKYLEHAMFKLKSNDYGAHDWEFDKPGSEIYDYGNNLGSNPDHCDNCYSYNSYNNKLKALQGNKGGCSIL
jgi:hypothetical protein